MSLVAFNGLPQKRRFTMLQNFSGARSENKDVQKPL
jgi:hypothetical protein